ncbi:hypothetical protein PVK06_040799 [Gossypium arboreum]|uniref:Uncharacterized protein n=5 Tax=rosids TaxID=71275 RepID=A0ABR0N6H5_GOSAR|nr:hypothetical protein PVK06_040799 [Gossypium arboreum]
MSTISSKEREEKKRLDIYRCRDDAVEYSFDPPPEARPIKPIRFGAISLVSVERLLLLSHPPGEVTEGEDHRLDGSKRGPFLSTYPVEDKMDAVSGDSFGALILCASGFPDLSSVPAVRKESHAKRVNLLVELFFPHPVARSVISGVTGYDRGGSMRDLILLPEILPSVAVGDNTKMCLTSLILFVAAQKIIKRMGNPLLKIRLARQRREIDPSGLGPKVPSRFRIDTGDKSTVRPLHQKRFANSAYPECKIRDFDIDMSTPNSARAYKPKDLAVPPDLYKSESMAYLTEVTLLRSWTANWLQYVKWYYTQALLPSVLLKDFFDAPVFTRHWKVKSEDPELIRFGLLWRLYDEVAKKGPSYMGFILADNKLTHPLTLLRGVSGTEFLWFASRAT